MWHGSCTDHCFRQKAPTLTESDLRRTAVQWPVSDGSGNKRKYNLLHHHYCRASGCFHLNGWEGTMRLERLTVLYYIKSNSIICDLSVSRKQQEHLRSTLILGLLRPAHSPAHFSGWTEIRWVTLAQMCRHIPSNQICFHYTLRFRTFSENSVAENLRND